MTDDFSLIGEHITLEIYPVSNLIIDATVEYITLEILFTTLGPEFKDIPKLVDLHCNNIDKDWKLNIPEIRF